MVAAAAAVGWWARRRGHPALLGLCVGLALCKPQLGACVALPLLWGAPNSRRQQLVGLSAGLSVLLALSLVVVGPSGFAAYLRLTHAFGASTQASSAVAADGLGLAALPHVLGLAALPVIAASGLILVLRGWRTATDRTATDRYVAAACALLVLILPYSHQYDSVALLPALTVAWHARPGRGMALVGLLVLTTPLAAVLTVPLPFRLLPLALLLWTVLATSGISIQHMTLSRRLQLGLAGRR